MYNTGNAGNMSRIERQGRLLELCLMFLMALAQYSLIQSALSPAVSSIVSSMSNSVSIVSFSLMHVQNA